MLLTWILLCWQIFLLFCPPHSNPCYLLFVATFSVQPRLTSFVGTLIIFKRFNYKLYSKTNTSKYKEHVLTKQLNCSLCVSWSLILCVSLSSEAVSWFFVLLSAASFMEVFERRLSPSLLLCLLAAPKYSPLSSGCFRFLIWRKAVFFPFPLTLKRLGNFGSIVGDSK